MKLHNRDIKVKLHNEELNSLCFYPNIIRMIKSKRIGWAEHVECMGRRGMHIES
jgi:hypothetical protein